MTLNPEPNKSEAGELYYKGCNIVKSYLSFEFSKFLWILYLVAPLHHHQLWHPWSESW